MVAFSPRWFRMKMFYIEIGSKLSAQLVHSTMWSKSVRKKEGGSLSPAAEGLIFFLFFLSLSVAHLNSLCSGSSSSLGICEAIRAENERCHQDDHLPTTLRRPLDSSNWITVAQLYTKTVESKVSHQELLTSTHLFSALIALLGWDRWGRKLPILGGRLWCQPGWQTHVSTSIWHSVDRKEMATAAGYFC